jgi:hypothetical protein
VTSLDGFVGRQEELRILDERLSDAESGRPQVVFVEAEAGAGKSTLLSWFLALHPNVVAVSTSGDEAETLLSYGVMDQLLPGALTEPGADPMAIGAQLVDFLDRLQNDDKVVVLTIDDVQWADRLSMRAILFALRRLRADRVLTIVCARLGEMSDPAGCDLLAATHVSRVCGLGVLGRTTSRFWPARWVSDHCHAGGRIG